MSFAKKSQSIYDELSTTDYHMFANRSHFICYEPGYEEVLNVVASWVEQKENAPAYDVAHIKIDR